MYVDNKALSQQSQEQKSLKNVILFVFFCVISNDCRDCSEVFLMVLMYQCDILEVF